MLNPPKTEVRWNTGSPQHTWVPKMLQGVPRVGAVPGSAPVPGAWQRFLVRSQPCHSAVEGNGKGKKGGEEEEEQQLLKGAGGWK